MKLVKQEENDLYFEVIVRPPVTIVDFNGFYGGPDFRDQLIFEATSDVLEEIDFFTFFKKSKVYFESRYARVNSTNPIEVRSGAAPASGESYPQFKDEVVSMVPIFGGKIGVPFPWVDRLIFDFSMFQNLGNLTPHKLVRLQYSEFSFGVNYLWSGKESWGRPQLIPGVDFRGRNMYQTYFTGLSGKPFVIGSTYMPSIGVETSWFPGGLFVPWEHWGSRLGVEFTYRQSLLGRIQTKNADGPTIRSLNGYMFDANLQLRLTRKWAIAAGYQRTAQSFLQPPTSRQGAGGKTLEDILVREALNSFYVRLILVPYILEGDQ